MSKRMSAGEVEAKAELAETVAEIEILRVRLEGLQGAVARLAVDLDTILSRPPFTTKDDRG